MMYKKINQNGAAALLLAMFFVILITLVTIGFATLVRRDQRATLDKTLSKQAQYAAESGINAVRNYVDRAKAAGTLTSNSNCNPSALAPTYQAPDFSGAGGSGVSLSCLTWSTEPTELSFELGEFGSNYSFNNKNHQGYSVLSWETDGATAAGDVYTGLANSPTKMPNIVAGKKSIIKLVTVVRADVYNSPPKVNVAYLVPTDKGRVLPVYTSPQTGGNNAIIGTPRNDYVDLGNAYLGTASVDRTNGMVYYVPCTGTTCTVHIAGYPTAVSGVYEDRLFYFQNLGDAPTTLTYKAVTNPWVADTPQPLRDVAVKVDANAIAQDTSKRLVAYIPINEQTWQPWFGAMSDSLCKDYQVDGSNSTTAPGSPSVTPCPN